MAVCGDGEYVIYTAQRLRNKSFGSGLDFVWASGGTGDYAVREVRCLLRGCGHGMPCPRSRVTVCACLCACVPACGWLVQSSSQIAIYKNFKVQRSFRPSFSAQQLWGGALIAVRSNDFVCFYDWASDTLVRRIDEVPEHVIWSDNGELVVLATEESFFVLRYDASAVAAAAHAVGEEAKTIQEEGVEAAFDVEGDEVNERVRSGLWVGDCFVYTNYQGRLNYIVGGKTVTVAHLDHPMHVLGYLAKENRLYLVDKFQNICAYELQLSILQYQTAVVRRDFESANQILAEIPEDQYNAIARFLEGQGFKEEALMVATDPDQKLDLAVELKRLDVRHVVWLCCGCGCGCGCVAVAVGGCVAVAVSM